MQNTISVIAANVFVTVVCFRLELSLEGRDSIICYFIELVKQGSGTFWGIFMAHSAPKISAIARRRTGRHRYFLNSVWQGVAGQAGSLFRHYVKRKREKESHSSFLNSPWQSNNHLHQLGCQNCSFFCAVWRSVFFFSFIFAHISNCPPFYFPFSGSLSSSKLIYVGIYERVFVYALEDAVSLKHCHFPSFRSWTSAWQLTQAEFKSPRWLNRRNARVWLPGTITDKHEVPP